MRIARVMGPVLGLVLAGVATAAVGGPTAAASTTRWVDKDGTAGPTGCAGTRTASKTIKRAIGLAKPGDTIVVCKGVFRETLSISGAAKAGLTIKAAVAGKAIVRTPSSISGALVEITDTSTITLSGLALRIDTVLPCGRVTDALHIADSDRVTVSGVTVLPRGTFTMNPCGYEVGARILASAPVTIKGSTFTDFQTAGVRVEQDSTVTVRASTFKFLHATIPFGAECQGDVLHVSDGGRLTVRGSTITGLTGAGTVTPCFATGVLSDSVPNTTVITTTIRYGRSGIRLVGENGHVLTDVTIKDGRGTSGDDGEGTGIYGDHITGGSITRATVTGMRKFGLALAASSGVTVTDGDFRGNTSTDCVDSASFDNTWTGNLGDESMGGLLCSTS